MGCYFMWPGQTSSASPTPSSTGTTAPKRTVVRQTVLSREMKTHSKVTRKVSQMLCVWGEDRVLADPGDFPKSFGVALTSSQCPYLSPGGLGPVVNIKNTGITLSLIPSRTGDGIEGLVHNRQAPFILSCVSSTTAEYKTLTGGQQTNRCRRVIFGQAKVMKGVGDV